LSGDAEALIKALREQYRSRVEALEAKERECQQERASLEIIAACIGELEGKAGSAE
jgi:hypothetical protein